MPTTEAPEAVLEPQDHVARLKRSGAAMRAARLLEAQVVQEARSAGLSWDVMGALYGVPGETLRRRYGAA